MNRDELDAFRHIIRADIEGEVGSVLDGRSFPVPAYKIKRKK